MTTKLDIFHQREDPLANHTQAKDRMDVMAIEARRRKRQRRLARRNNGAIQASNDASLEIEAIRAELRARISACFDGSGTVFDHRFLADHLGQFEKPLGEGNGSISITLLEFND